MNEDDPDTVFVVELWESEDGMRISLPSGRASSLARSRRCFLAQSDAGAGNPDERGVCPVV